MEARKVQEIFNSTVIKDIEIEILSTQHEVDRRHFEYEAGEEVIKCLLGTRKHLLNKKALIQLQRGPKSPAVRDEKTCIIYLCIQCQQWHSPQFQSQRKVLPGL